jgi:hypothetical protein
MTTLGIIPSRKYIFNYHNQYTVLDYVLNQATNLDAF